MSLNQIGSMYDSVRAQLNAIGTWLPQLGLSNFGGPVDPAVNTATFEVDYVRVYQ